MESTGPVGQAVGVGRGIVTTQITKQTSALGGRLIATAHGLRSAAQQLESQGNGTAASGFTGDLAGNLEQFGTYLRDSDLDRLMQDADEVVSRAPVAFTTAALFAGIAVARFLRASGRAGETARESETSAPAATRKRRKRRAGDPETSANGKGA